jgi:hypothetical protein
MMELESPSSLPGLFNVKTSVPLGRGRLPRGSDLKSDNLNNQKKMAAKDRVLIAVIGDEVCKATFIMPRQSCNAEISSITLEIGRFSRGANGD